MRALRTLFFMAVASAISTTATAQQPDLFGGHRNGLILSDSALAEFLKDKNLPPAPSHLSLSCPTDTKVQPCRLVNDLTSVPPGSAGLTLYLSGSKAADLSRQAADGRLTQASVRAVLQEKTIGLLPEAIESKAAATAIRTIEMPALAKSGRVAVVVGAALMSYAAYQYFFPPEDDKDKRGHKNK